MPEDIPVGAPVFLEFILTIDSASLLLVRLHGSFSIHRIKIDTKLLHTADLIRQRRCFCYVYNLGITNTMRTTLNRVRYYLHEVCSHSNRYRYELHEWYRLSVSNSSAFKIG